MKTRVVLVDRNIMHCNFEGIYYDDTQAIYDATTLLLNEGHWTSPPKVDTEEKIIIQSNRR